ncbi:MAG: sulfatase [Planctomycetes bacterium]|nr:sulfatase [Planctomycetota bacterium]
MRARIALLLATAAGSVACTREPALRFEHIVVVSLDTVRADRLGCYGHAAARTPVLDALARRGIVFDAATAAAPTTLASHTAVFTGLHPHAHGVARNGFTVAAENVTLAELARASGFRTAAFLGSFALDRRFGLAQGFDTWDQAFDVDVDGNHEQMQRSAAQVTDAALSWVEREGPERFLLFAHYFDAHAPYEPPPPFDVSPTRPTAPRSASLADVDVAVRAQQRRTTGRELGVQKTIVGGLDAALLDGADGQTSPADEDLAALYDGEIAYVDRELGRLLDGLERKGLLRNALVVVFADHGETFAEHADYWNHGLWTYDTTVRVPFLVVATGPGAEGLAPRRVPDPVSMVDVLPTVAALAGFAAPEGLDGTSLVDAMRGGTLPRRAVFSEATQPVRVERPRTPATPWENALKAKCVRIGDFKLIRAPYLAREQLFDVAKDPGERRDLLRAGVEASELARAPLAELRAALDRFEREARPRPSRFDPSQTLETQAKLRGLGYDEGANPDDPPPEHTPR